MKKYEKPSIEYLDLITEPIADITGDGDTGISGGFDEIPPEE